MTEQTKQSTGAAAAPGTEAPQKVKKIKSYRVYVRCVSIERFDVEAPSRGAALLAYEAGECTLEGDEVEEREVVDVVQQ